MKQLRSLHEAGSLNRVDAGKANVGADVDASACCSKGANKGSLLGRPALMKEQSSRYNN